jgi:Ca-activated chloride channel family protein
MSTRRIRPLAFCIALLGMIASVQAQGVLIVVDPAQHVRLPRPIPIPMPRPAPPPPVTYKIKDLSVQAKLTDQIARVQVSQSFVNTGSRTMEVAFVFPLPYDGAVDRMTLLIDGKEHPAQLLKAEEARKMYEEIVRKNQDPALLEWIGTGLFKTSVFPVPPGQERKVTLRYSQICRNQGGLTDFLFPLSTAKYTSKPVENVSISVSIESAIEIKNVYSPTHALDVKRPDGHHATISYTGKNVVPSEDFRLFYDVDTSKVGTALLSYRPESEVEGFFLLLASPQIKAPDAARPPKTVVFVVDRSGSMSGEKIEQAKGALKFVLNNLREGDLFNIVAYDAEIESFRDELQKFSDETRTAALGFVEGLYAGGSTNIDGALTTALSQLKDSARPSYVIFLTDGLPTTGERNESKIVAHAGETNDVRARVFAFGVGYDVNSRLLDRLVRSNYGQSHYVRPDEDIESHVSTLYNRIESPVLTDVSLKFSYDDVTKPEEGEPVSRLYPKGTFDLFEGEQLVVVGRYRKGGTVKITVEGSLEGETQTFDFPAEMVEKSTDESYAFIEKLWAMRRVGEIIDEIDLKGKNDELVKELVELATRHGILTPYTSFLADENTALRDLSANTTRARGHLGRLEDADGASGFDQRVGKANLQNAAQAGGGFSAESAPGLGISVEQRKQVRHVGNKAFFRRQDRWVDSTVSEDQERNAIRVTQFSDAYFDLARENGKTVSQYLVFDEPVLVNVRGQAYWIDPPTKN